MREGIKLAGTKWMRKFFVVLVSILTLGLVTPSDLSWLVDANSNQNPSKDIVQQKNTDETTIFYEEVESFDREQFLEEMLQQAEESANVKLGEKIQPVIEDQFNAVILPKIDEAILEITKQFPGEELQYLTIHENLKSGRGEKIFHIYDEKSGKDIIRFHVRQDKKPLEGYWFNFHYHTYHDQYAAHYPLGSIFWSKNTPPTWGGKLS